MTINDQQLDELLAKSALEPPAGFSDRLMARIENEQPGMHQEPAALPASLSTQSRCSITNLIQWSVLATGGLLGFFHCASFTLGVWFATAAG